MKSEIDGEYEGLTTNKNLFYTNEDEKEAAMIEAENIAYEQLKAELIRIGQLNLIQNIGTAEADYLEGGKCIYRSGDFWLVFHSERNIRSNLSIFSSPYDAVNFYIWGCICDPSKENLSVGCIPKINTIFK